MAAVQDVKKIASNLPCIVNNISDKVNMADEIYVQNENT